MFVDSLIIFARSQKTLNPYRRRNLNTLHSAWQKNAQNQNFTPEISNPQQEAEVKSAFCSLKSSGILPVIPVFIPSGKKQESSLALCDSGGSLSFTDKMLAGKLNAHGEEIDLSVAGIHGTIDVKYERFTVRIRGKTKSESYPHDSLRSSKYRRRNKDLQPSGAQTCLSPLVGSKRRNIETQRCIDDFGTKLLPNSSAWRIKNLHEWWALGSENESWIDRLWTTSLARSCADDCILGNSHKMMLWQNR